MPNLRQYLPTRDSSIWTVGLLLGGIATAITTLGLKPCDPQIHAEWVACAADASRFAYYGIPDRIVPYIRLLAILTPIISAWMKSSPASHSVYGEAKTTIEDRRSGQDQPERRSGEDR